MTLKTGVISAENSALHHRNKLQIRTYINVCVRVCVCVCVCSVIFLIYSCDAKLSFQQILLPSSVSHDPSEILLIC